MNKPLAKKLIQSVLADAKDAGRMVPPAWPLNATVAVNPYLGQTGESLADTAARLARVTGEPVTMPRAWYGAKIEAGEVTDEDIAAALETVPNSGLDVSSVKEAVTAAETAPQALPTVADLAAQASGIDWPAIVTDRIGHWTAGWFDQGQALWAAPQGYGAYNAWRSYATHDLSTEIAGLSGFSAFVDATPQRPDEALAQSAKALGLTEDARPTVFHRLYMTLGGWAQIARWRLWQAELKDSTDTALTDMLAIRLVFEDALLAHYHDDIAEIWAETVKAHEEPLAPSDDQIIDMVLQEAADHAAQRGLISTVSEIHEFVQPARPAVQAAFCIDVRSEVFRRALEGLSPEIETIGFAGFFGLPLSHRRFGSVLEETHLPVLLNPGVNSASATSPDLTEKEDRVRILARTNRAWGRFKLAAVSSFAFVEAAGPIYVGKLFRDALGLTEKAKEHDPAPQLDPSLDLATRIEIANTVLRAMSMTSGFGRIVMLAGHGANVVNNAHASALHCGACGGQTGEVSARALAGLLNEPDVRKGVAKKGIDIPADTLFLGALHDTTTDRITLFTQDVKATRHKADVKQLETWLTSAGQIARGERALRLPRAQGETDIAYRARDWAEVRPEWALAGCKAFIAAPRNRTAGKSLEGRAFLHSYDWKQDSDFGVLELIMTAPVVVASWISLQYYGSTVSPKTFGAGNKLLHNVVGGIGVIEGNGGTPRVGLSWQSVHDGEELAHEPLRLSVMIEAPREAMITVLKKHPDVRDLFDNRWLHLFALDDEGQVAWRYSGDLEWEAIDRPVLSDLKLVAA
ncbi:MAG: DUF2309 domain-containing protein [Pseudomonadota bacterium]